MRSDINWSGIFPVVPTPLLKDESLDSAGLSHLVNFYIDSGCHGLVILGSGGEYPYFTFQEKLLVIEIAVGEVKGRVPVIAGGGFYSLMEALKFIRAADGLGIYGFLVALPTYYPIGLEEAYNFYSQLCKDTEKPIFYYHYPQITGLHFSPKQISRILSIDGIQGIKESSLNITEMRKHLQSVKKDKFALFSGNSFLLLDTLAIGGHGVICPIASVTPRLVVDCFNAWQSKDFTRVRKLQDEILDFLPLMNSFNLPVAIQKAGLKLISHAPFRLKMGNLSRHAVIKETLRQLGHPISARVRSPLPQITEKEKQAISELIASLGLKIDIRAGKI